MSATTGAPLADSSPHDMSNAGQTTDLDKQVEQLRAVLNDRLRVAQVSSGTFPLRVWERMFALDRDKRAGVSDSRNNAAAAAGNSGGGGLPVGDRGDSPPGSHTMELTNRSSGGGGGRGRGNDETSLSFTTDTQHSNSHRQMQLRAQKKVESTTKTMRACRAGTLSSTFMRDLVRSSVTGPRTTAAVAGAIDAAAASSVLVEPAGRKRSPSPDAASPPPLPAPPTRSSPTGSSGGSVVVVGAAASTAASPAVADIYYAHRPVATLECVTVPPRTRTGSAAAAGVYSSAVGASSAPTAAAVSGAPLGTTSTTAVPAAAAVIAAAASAAAVARRVSMERQDEVLGLRAEPIRPFAPVASMWNCAALDDPSVSTRRPAVERHDLPFDVTPANDFRKLPFPLTGLGHAVPYLELQDELCTMLDRIDALEKIAREKR